jgi:hypothetical protein
MTGAWSSKKALSYSHWLPRSETHTLARKSVGLGKKKYQNFRIYSATFTILSSISLQSHSLFSLISPLQPYEFGEPILEWISI